MSARLFVEDRLLLIVGSMVCLGALIYGSQFAAESHETRENERRFQPRRVLGSTDPSIAAGLAALPPGVRVDPTTGLMVGVRITTSEGVTPVPWEVLRSYEYQANLEGMPEGIKKLDGTRVAMLGFMWAIYDYDDIHKFGLVGSHWSCCYGIPPGLADVVIVTLRDDQDGLAQTLNPIRVEGTLHIAEKKEQGYTVAIYEMADVVATVLEY